MDNFSEIEYARFPASGTPSTPAHTLSDFDFKAYAPRAFRHFREEFGIKAEDFMVRCKRRIGRMVACVH